MVDSKTFEDSIVKKVIVISARLNSRSKLIFFHFKNNWLRNSHNYFCLRLFFFEAIQLFFSKNLGHSKSRFFSQPLSKIIEMPSLNRNERVACLECGREYTRKDVSRHRNHCGVLKCSNCNFYTYSNEELANHIKKKHFSPEHKVKKWADGIETHSMRR